ncbi:hypothetical protein MPSEU_001000300 [Mayamaea pseudoterrestris]|nr:hypothetical protein MPSEU_001000300 [Mayamaea pseudoterrestris]
MVFLSGLRRSVLFALLFGSAKAHSNHRHHHHHSDDKTRNGEPFAVNVTANEHVHWNGIDGDSSEFCGAHVTEQEDRMMSEAQEVWEQRNPIRLRRLRVGRELASIRIDVWFHIITGNTGDLSKSDQDFIINRLNEGFASTGFAFIHAGSTKTADGVNGAVNACSQSKLKKFRKYIRQGSPTTMNIIICDTSQGGRTLNSGFATSPTVVIIGELGLDGVGVPHPDVFGLAGTAESLIHEAGHWLGLKHTFQSASGDDTNGCDTTEFRQENGMYKMIGDGVADTPAHYTYTLNADCAYTTCCLDENGASTLNTCPSLPGVDPVRNFMNYIAPKCSANYGEFTPGQIARMVAQYETFRSPSRQLNCGCPKSCTEQVLNVTAYIANGVRYTCRDDIMDAISDLGDEWRGCLSTGSIYPSCKRCNSKTCSALAPDSSTSEPRERKSSPLAAMPVLKCARKVKRRCSCRGTLECRKVVIASKCNPPAGSAYRRSVLNQLKKSCN